MKSNKNLCPANNWKKPPLKKALKNFTDCKKTQFKNWKEKVNFNENQDRKHTISGIGQQAYLGKKIRKCFKLKNPVQSRFFRLTKKKKTKEKRPPYCDWSTCCGFFQFLKYWNREQNHQRIQFLLYFNSYLEKENRKLIYESTKFWYQSTNELR